MVERLKIAIEKAQQRRQQALASGSATQDGGQDGSSGGAVGAGGRALAQAEPVAWTALRELKLDPDRMRRERVVAYGKTEPSHVAFDVLRTRLLKVCRDNGWTRVGLTSPTKDCGKSVLAANLAFSLARNVEGRFLIVDMDLKAPRLATLLGVRERSGIGRLLTGQTPPGDMMARVGSNLAVAINTERESNSAELMQSSSTSGVLDGIMEALQPDLVLFDLPPMFVGDDVMSFLPNLDAVLLVAAAGHTRSHDIEECERLLAEATNFIGVVLNKYAAALGDAYAYDYARSP